MHSLSLFVLFVCIYFSLHTIEVLMESNDICDKNYLDASYMFDDGIKLVRHPWVWTYDFNFEFKSVIKEFDAIKTYTELDKTQMSDGEIFTGFYISDYDCKVSDYLSKKSMVMDMKSHNCGQTAKVVPCHLTNVLYKEKVALVYYNKQTSETRYMFKKKDGPNYIKLAGWYETPFRVAPHDILGGHIMPEGPDFPPLHRHLPVFLEIETFKIFVIRNRNSGKKSAALYKNQIVNENFNMTWCSASISNELMYIGFVRSKDYIYVLAEPFRESPDMRGPTKLLLLDPEKLTLTEQSSGGMTLFGCDDIDVSEWIGAIVLSSIIAIFAAIIVLLIIYFIVNAFRGKEKIVVISETEAQERKRN